LKYLRYKITPSVVDQLWELFSKSIDVERKKEIKRNTKPIKTGNTDGKIDEKEVTIEEKMEN
jgi:hypothetical protein